MEKAVHDVLQEFADKEDSRARRLTGLSTAQFEADLETVGAPRIHLRDVQSSAVLNFLESRQAKPKFDRFTYKDWTWERMERALELCSQVRFLSSYDHSFINIFINNMSSYDHLVFRIGDKVEVLG